MIIDNFYNETDKSHFYLGMISQVYRENSIIQIENLSWLAHRKIKLETLIPNTINYFVVIDTIQGLFIGEIYQAKISNTDNVHDSLTNGNLEKIQPEFGVEIIGLLEIGGAKFNLAGYQTVGVTDKVYIANEEILKLYLNSIEISDKDKEFELSSFANFSNMKMHKVRLKPSTLFNRHLMAVGTTNSGKSTSSLSVLDKLIKDKKKVLIIDPTSEYSESFTDEEIKKIKLGDNVSLSVGEVSMQQWAMIFETNDATQPALLADAIKSLRYQRKNDIYGIYTKVGRNVNDVINELATVSNLDKIFDLKLLPEQLSVETISMDKNNKYTLNNFNFNSNQWLVQKVQSKLEHSSFTSFFDRSNHDEDLIDILDDFLINKYSSLYVDSSSIGTSDGIGGMIVDLVSNYIINKSKDDVNPFVLFIDEVHRYTTTNINSDYYTGLVTIAREGRKKGIFLFLTTQNPQDVSDVLLGQVGTLLVHRLTHADEIKAIQNHLSSNNIGQVKNLNQGEAILSSINLLQDIHLNIIKSGRVHMNDTPNL